MTARPIPRRGESAGERAARLRACELWDRSGGGDEPAITAAASRSAVVPFWRERVAVARAVVAALESELATRAPGRARAAMAGRSGRLASGESADEAFNRGVVAAIHEFFDDAPGPGTAA